MPIAKLHHHLIQSTPSTHHADQLAHLDSLLAHSLPRLAIQHHHQLQLQPPSSPQKLIVTHDFKAGYSEDGFSTGYSFEWLGLVDIFIYFSHHRISVPPAQWILAAHTHHTRILGTLIFEHNSVSDLDLLLSGPSPPPPGSKHYLSLHPSGDPTDAISSYFADRLIDLACQRHFHGWLINIELDLRTLQPSRAVRLARALKVWVEYLRLEGERRVGGAWEVCWYDSVSHQDGRLQWQSRLHAHHNLPYFAAASSIFLDYHWSASHLAATAALLARLPCLPPQPHAPETQLLRLPSNPLASLAARPGLKQAIYVGVDVFGRGCPYGGGFASWRAARDVLAAGHSVALFGQGWTWESHHLHPDRQPATEGSEAWWTRWWRDERYFWTGLVEPGPSGELTSVEPPNAHVDACRIATEAKRPVPVRATSPSELPQHEPLATRFAARLLPPATAFYTNWSLGAGMNGFWAHGRQHVVGMRNWTDMGMSFPIHTLAVAGGKVWVIRDGVAVQEGLVQCDVTNKDGWLGSGSVEVCELVERTGEGDGVRVVWMNATNLESKTGTFTCRLVWKPRDPNRLVPLGIALDASPVDGPLSSVAVAGTSDPAVVVLGADVLPPTAVTVKSLPHGWNETVFQVAAPASPVVRLGITIRAPNVFEHCVGEMSILGEDSLLGDCEVAWENEVAPSEGVEPGSLWGTVRWSSSTDDEPVMWLVHMVESDGNERLIGSVRGCRELFVAGYVSRSLGSVKVCVRSVGWSGGQDGGGGECGCE